MTSISWWRSWHGAPTDHKWAVIAVRAGVKVGIVSAVAWALLDYASQHDSRGSVEGFDTETYAVYSGFDEREIIAVIQAMTDKGIIKDGRLSNWEKRQPQREDDSTPRVRKMREMKRNVTQSNAPDKDTDKDTDIYKEYDDDGGIQPSKPELFTLYQNNIGDITSIIAEELKSLAEDYPEVWITDAIGVAVEQNARNLAYIKAILKNRKAGKTRPEKSNGNGKKPPAQDAHAKAMEFLDKLEKGEVKL